MSERPSDVRIDDLAEPRLDETTLAVHEALGQMAAAGLDFSVDALEATATAATGLDDFGDDLHREPFAVVGESLRTEAALSPAGLATAHIQLVGLLANRLRVQDVVNKHPELLEVPVRAPIIIAGMPRSGTTHLHNLMAADPSLRSLPWWESAEPVAPPGEEGTIDGRIERARAGLEILNTALPYFNRMHEMTWDHVHEEINLLAMAGSTMFFDTLGRMPTWRAWYEAHDQTPYYEHLRRTLQVLQFLRGGDRWVLKSPQHLEQIGPLITTFPDATVVFTHRDPVSIVASFATMAGYTARLSHAVPIDVAAIGQWWAELIESMLNACVRDRHLVPDDQSIDVRFHEFMADDLAMVERIYTLADQPWTDDTVAALRAYLDGHPRGRHGRVSYDLADFGLDRPGLEARFATYVDRFGIVLER